MDFMEAMWQSFFNELTEIEQQNMSKEAGMVGNFLGAASRGGSTFAEKGFRAGLGEIGTAFRLGQTEGKIVGKNPLMAGIRSALKTDQAKALGLAGGLIGTGVAAGTVPGFVAGRATAPQQ